MHHFHSHKSKDFNFWLLYIIYQSYFSWQPAEAIYMHAISNIFFFLQQCSVDCDCSSGQMIQCWEELGCVCYRTLCTVHKFHSGLISLQVHLGRRLPLVKPAVGQIIQIWQRQTPSVFPLLHKSDYVSCERHQSCIYICRISHAKLKCMTVLPSQQAVRAPSRTSMLYFSYSYGAR